jgi:pimeloyl-ACP methyl ester carboxylesterase
LSHRYVLRVGISGEALVLNSKISGHPVLILAPDGSPFVDRSIAADLHALIARSELHWFPGQGHSLLMSGRTPAHVPMSNFLSVDTRTDR